VSPLDSRQCADKVSRDHSCQYEVAGESNTQDFEVPIPLGHLDMVGEDFAVTCSDEEALKLIVYCDGGTCRRYVRSRHVPSVVSYPSSKKMKLRPLYVCLGCSNHTYSNNMINIYNILINYKTTLGLERRLQSKAAIEI
jgi:hypothetical protein